MDYLTTVNTFIAYIPQLVETVRNAIPASMYSWVALGIALIGAYLFLKQFVVDGLFRRMSVILNYILLALLFYVLLLYART